MQSSGESEKDEGSKISKPGRKTNFSKEATSILKKWLLEHVEHPYLKTVDKHALSKESGLTKKQVSNWFTNVRKVCLIISIKKFVLINLNFSRESGSH